MQSPLFDNFPLNRVVNLLPEDGRVEYFPRIFDEFQSSNLITQFLESLVWESDQLVIFGKKITTRRQVAWVGDPNCTYTYSGVKKHPQAWTSELLMIKSTLENLVGSEFNSCLLNLYFDGNDGMGWHSDDEKELVSTSPIASVSFGAQRKFAFRHKKNKQTIPVFLENGSTLIMHAPTQKFWQHALLKSKVITEPRINLTFRKISS